MGFPFFVSYFVAWILVVFQGLLILALLKQLSELKQLVELKGVPGADRLPVGTEAPEFKGLDLRSGRPITTQIFEGQGGALLFLSPECGSCVDVANGLHQPALSGLPPILTVCQGNESSCASFINRLGMEVYTLRDDDNEVATRYRIDGSPTAIIINPDVTIRAYGHPQTIEDLKRLLGRTLGTGAVNTEATTTKSMAAVSSEVPG
jgi:AhpC/TSA family